MNTVHHFIYKRICASFETGKTIPNRWFYFCGLGLKLKTVWNFFSFYSTYKQYKLFWYFFLFRILKTQNWDFWFCRIFFAFSHSFKYQKFFAAKTLTQMSHLFSIAGLGPIVFFYRWITWPGVFLGCFLVLAWCCFLLTDWILLFSWFFRISHLSHDWRPSSCLLCLSTTGFCSLYCRGDPDQFISWHHIRLWRSCCCSSSSCLVSHVFYFFLLFSLYHWSII